MLARSHVVVGLAAWAVAATLLRLPPLDPAYLALAAAGSLLPDVDPPKSWIGRRIPPLAEGGWWLLARRPLGHWPGIR